MTRKLLLRQTVLRNGERYPLLLDSHGQPSWYPTLYATTQLRNASKASSTISSVLAAIRLLLAWYDVEGIELEKRLARRDFLRIQEVESLCRYMQTKANVSTKH